VKLWFSGHFHLSHNYPDSISVVGGAAFVQVGVIGECNRDGQRHSRVLSSTRDGYQLYTMDHDDGTLRLDLEAGWSASDVPVPVPLSEDELLCDPTAGWLCSPASPIGADTPHTKWFPAGPSTLLALHDDLLVEYDAATRAPMGLVTRVPDGAEVLLRDAAGRPGSAPDGSDVAEVAVANANTGPEVYPRNEHGGFWRVYQPNKWRLRKMKEAAEREAAAEADEAAAVAAAAAKARAIAGSSINLTSR